MSTRILEICANSATSCIEAEHGGAARVELCAGIPEGGTTPSYGEIRTALESCSLRVHVIIRPRGGDFLYSPEEIRSMLYDIALVRQVGAHGVVFGCLTPQGDIDTELLRRLVDAAKPDLSVTFHRAFDVCRNPQAALEQLIAAGCDRVLTSGQQPTARQGAPLIRELVHQAAGRIIVMPGCGVRPGNIAEIEAATGATEFHTSARSIVHSRMEFRNDRVPMGSCPPASEFEIEVTDRRKVAACLR